MYIAKNNDLIILAKDTREELEQALKFMVYTSIEETETEYQFYGGEYLTVDEIAQREAERIAQLHLTKREVFLALYRDKGITPEQLRAQITNPEALIEFEYANDYFRGNPLINIIGQMLGYTSGDLDYLFEHGELPTREEIE
ncbi:MAG: hypothetical protein II453_09860 [Alphaproteobacteria bacterium]|nr:hypothetical protein [Alphaproteobacteria bacterium]MBQ3946375.1 hypothetical protein [Alphaproteobacteria bacterium]